MMISVTECERMPGLFIRENYILSGTNRYKSILHTFSYMRLWAAETQVTKYVNWDCTICVLGMPSELPLLLCYLLTTWPNGMQRLPDEKVPGSFPVRPIRNRTVLNKRARDRRAFIKALMRVVDVINACQDRSCRRPWSLPTPMGKRMKRMYIAYSLFTT